MIETKKAVEMAFSGIISEKTTAFIRLEQLLEQEVFEISEETVKENGKIRVIYMMNDAVESFLVFEEATITGTVLEEFEGSLDGELVEREQGYMLIVHQGEENVFTISFINLVTEDYFYNYGSTAHFWISGYDHLRQLEYRLAILRDKCDYIGGTEEEWRLSALACFPPLNACCYPSVSEKYYQVTKEMWQPAEEAFEVMNEYAGKCGDRTLSVWLWFYKQMPSAFVARRLAIRMRRKGRRRVIEKITDDLKEAASVYENRSFGEKMGRIVRDLLLEAEKEAEKFRKEGFRTDVVREEPFVHESDGIGFQTALLIWKDGIFNTKPEIKRLKNVKESN